LVKVYGVPSCDQIKKTKSLLENNIILFTFVNIRKQPLEQIKLDRIISQLGIDIVLNRRGMLYRKLGLKDKNLSDADLATEVFNEQGMIKRPLIEFKNKFLIGYDEQAILSFLKT